MAEKKRLKWLLHEQNGFTLVELLVTFTLLLLLMTAAFSVISPSANVFMKAVSAGRTQNVSSILMDRIINELETATEIIEVSPAWVEYIDSGGNDVVMQTMVDKGSGGGTSVIFTLEYYMEDGGGSTWDYPKKVYAGNTIETLEFSEVEDRDDLVQVELKLKNSQTGYEYGRKRIVKCYAAEETK